MSKVKLPEIGSKMYAIHKKSVDDKHNGARMLICKVKTYENIGGKVRPVLSVVGASRQEVSQNSYYIYNTLEKAVKALTFKA